MLQGYISNLELSTPVISHRGRYVLLGVSDSRRSTQSILHFFILYCVLIGDVDFELVSSPYGVVFLIYYLGIILL
jgi:hypothetical protein